MSLTPDGGYKTYQSDRALNLAEDIRFDENRPEDFELLTEDDLIEGSATAENNEN